MKLFLLRHAEAHHTSPDKKRELTARGAHSIQSLAKFLAGRIELDIDAIWHSPLERAVQTASIFRDHAGLSAELVETNGLQPMDNPSEIIQLIEAQSDNLLLVGHNPHFESLVAELLQIDTIQVPINVPKASFLRFHRDGNQWQLRDHLTAKVTGN